MKILFQADANLNEDIVLGLLRLEPLIDFQTADEAELRGVTDDLVLKRAAEEGRILVTSDRRTMPDHFAAFIGRSHSPGVFIVAQNLSIRTAIEELLLIWSASEGEEWVDRIVDLPL
ncbi:MAG: DUF5615 family PIN-like protein [Blastocatellia bacterium]